MEQQQKKCDGLFQPVDNVFKIEKPVGNKKSSHLQTVHFYRYTDIGILSVCRVPALYRNGLTCHRAFFTIC